MEIRNGREEDIPQLEELLYQVHAVHAEGRPDLFRAGEKKYTAQELHSLLRDGDRPVFVAEEDGEILGYAMCIVQRQTGRSMYPVVNLFLDDLCVSQRARGRGIGGALYRHVVAVARERGYYSVRLHVWDCNAPAKQFYARQGMKVLSYTMEEVLREESINERER